MLSRMDYPEFPVPVGVFRAVERPTYDDLMTEQIAKAVGGKASTTSTSSSARATSGRSK